MKHTLIALLAVLLIAGIAMAQNAGTSKMTAGTQGVLSGMKLNGCDL